jgi:hypothetical protein
MLLLEAQVSLLTLALDMRNYRIKHPFRKGGLPCPITNAVYAGQPLTPVRRLISSMVISATSKNSKEKTSHSLPSDAKELVLPSYSWRVKDSKEDLKNETAPD